MAVGCLLVDCHAVKTLQSYWRTILLDCDKDGIEIFSEDNVMNTIDYRLLCIRSSFLCDYQVLKILQNEKNLCRA